MSDPLLLALPGVVLGLIPAYLVYRRGQKTDKIAEQAGIATVESGTIGQVIDGLNKLNGNLQTDNAIHRAALEDCQRDLAAERTSNQAQ